MLNQKYNEGLTADTEKFEKTDLIIAIAVFILLFVISYLQGIFIGGLGEPVSENILFIVQFIIVYLFIGLLAGICKMRRQCLTSLLRIRLRDIGFVIIIIFIVGSMYIICGGKENYSLSKIIVRLLYYLFVIAIPEEIIFREYLGKRFDNLISNHFAAVLLVGVLFAIAHFPFKMGINGDSILGLNYWFDWFTYLKCILVHMFLYFIYHKNNNIRVPVIIHWIWDFGVDYFF